MDTRWSVEFQTRRQLLKTLKVPKQSEAKIIAGLPLSLVIFEETHPDLKEDFGLQPFLKGPPGELWVSPSDLLIGKVALKPPLTQKHVQALTHEGIIDLGVEIEQRFINEYKTDKENALKERELYLRKVFDVEKARAVAEALEEEGRKHRDHMNAMRNAFENKISQLLWECFQQVANLEEQMRVEIDSLNVIWQRQLDIEIQETTERITLEFLEKMRLQEQVLVSIYRKQMREHKMKKKCAIDFERTKCKEMLIQMKHKLHCQNIANLMYLLCKERRKCKKEKNVIQEDFSSQIKKLKHTITLKTNRIKKLLEVKEKKSKQIKVRERCLIEILRQFQKFIYFALKAAPTQGEFLLNINKLIKYELDDYCIPTEESMTKIQESEIEKIEASIEQETEDYSKQIEDFLEESQSEEMLEESDVLPAFYFNDKIYVREDFRDMLEAGVDIDRQNSLWNPDVEELIEIFRRQIESKRECQLVTSRSHHSSVHFGQDKSSSGSYSDQILTISPTDTEPPEEINQEAIINVVTMDEEEKEIRKISINKEEKKKEKKPRKPSIVIKDDSESKKKDSDVSDIVNPVMISNPATQSRLTLTRDSVILHLSNIERKSLQCVAKMHDGSIGKRSNTSEPPPEFEEEAKEGREAEKKGASGSIESQESLEKPTSEQGSLEKPPSRPTSKLLLANDSYELIKSTIALVGDKEREKEAEPEPKPERKSLLTFSPKASGTKPKTPRGKMPPKQVAKVAGSRTAQKESIEEFTEERIKDLVNVMKENPSLIRLFTPCSK